MGCRPEVRRDPPATLGALPMFDSLSEKLQRVFKELRGEGHLTEFHVDQALQEIRTALLEADVSLPVVKDFVAAVREKSIGHEVLTSFSPAQQVVRIVHYCCCYGYFLFHPF